MEIVLFLGLFVLPALIIYMWWFGALHLILRIALTGVLAYGFWYSWTSDNYFDVLLNPSIYASEELVTVETEERLRKEVFTEDESQNDLIRASVAMEEALEEMGHLSTKLYEQTYAGDKEDWLNDFDEQLDRMHVALPLITTALDEEELEPEQIAEFGEFLKYMYLLQEMLKSVREDDSPETEEGFVYALWLLYGDFGVSE